MGRTRGSTTEQCLTGEKFSRACVVFRRQGGANLLVVGQRGQMALEMATCVLNLAAEVCGEGKE